MVCEVYVPPQTYFNLDMMTTTINFNYSHQFGSMSDYVIFKIIWWDCHGGMGVVSDYIFGYLMVS